MPINTYNNSNSLFIDFGYGYPQFIENQENLSQISMPFVRLSSHVSKLDNIWFLPPAIMKDEVFTYLSEKYVPNTMNRYIISNYGRLYDVVSSKFVPFRFNKKFSNDPTASNKGYCAAHVSYYKSPYEIATKDIYIHRAVLMSFCYVEGCEALDVNHKDGIHLNNTLGNLEWLTSKENIIHSFDAGLCMASNEIRTTNKRLQIDESDADKICNMYISGCSLRYISDKLNIYQNIVFNTISGNIFPEVSSKYSICISNIRIPDESIHKLCELISKGIPISDISAYTGISKYELMDIRDRKLYADISMDYNFDKALDINSFRRSLSNSTVHEICRRIQKGYSLTEISNDMNVDLATISNIKNRKVYKHIAALYNFSNCCETKLEDELVHSICKDIENGMRNVDIANKYNISRITVGHIRRGETFTHISKNYNMNAEITGDFRNLSVSSVRAICSRLQAGETPTAIANDMNINVRAINSIHQGLSYKDISKDYTFSVKDHWLSEDKVRAVCEALQRGDRLIDIINTTGVSKRSIYRIKNRELYHDITKDYNY